MKWNPSLRAPVTGPQPCFTDYDPAKPLEGAKHTFSIGLTTTYDANGQLSVGLGPVSLGGSGEVKSITGQTLLVNFEQKGLADIQHATTDRTARAGSGAGRPSPPDDRQSPPSKDHPRRGVLSTPYRLDALTEDELRRSIRPQVSPPPSR